MRATLVRTAILRKPSADVVVASQWRSGPPHSFQLEHVAEPIPVGCVDQVRRGRGNQYGEPLPEWWQDDETDEGCAPQLPALRWEQRCPSSRSLLRRGVFSFVFYIASIVIHRRLFPSNEDSFWNCTCQLY